MRWSWSLDPVSKVISGMEILHWTNGTAFPAADLRFHLYYNASRDEESSFLHSNRMASSAFRDWSEDEWAHDEIVSVTLRSDQGQKTADLTSLVDYIQPDDGNAHDRTVMRKLLPEAIVPGATVHLKIEFKSKVPRTFAPTGFRGRYFFITQWFPKLGVFEQNGTWNCHQFI